MLLATGASPRRAGFAGEEEFRGHGVAYCATCDGEFFSGRPVFVVGGGFAAAEEAVFLTRYASHVTVLVREDDFTCAKATADATRANPDITVHTNAELVSVSGDSVVRSLVWKDGKIGETHEAKPDDGGTVGVFVFVGYAPATELVRGLAELDPQGYVITDEHQMTTADGLFAAGDICQKRLRQVATAVGEGAATATEMERYLKAAQEKTGIHPVQPATRVQKATPKKEEKKVSSDGPIDDAMHSQLAAVFDRMEKPLVLELHLDDGEIASELAAYMEALAQETDKLSVTRADTSSDDAAELPYVSVLRDGVPCGMSFHGVPGGHEFTSFVLGLYNASGPGQQIAAADREAIAAISRPVKMKVLVGLSCTMCPEVAVATQRIAAENPKVETAVYDVNRFPALKDAYDVMSVPCLVINDGGDERVAFGKKGLTEILSLIGV